MVSKHNIVRTHRHGQERNQVPSIKPGNWKIQMRGPDSHGQSVTKRQNVKLKHNVTPGKRCYIPKDSGRDLSTKHLISAPVSSTYTKKPFSSAFHHHTQSP